MGEPSDFRGNSRLTVVVSIDIWGEETRTSFRMEICGS